MDESSKCGDDVSGFWKAVGVELSGAFNIKLRPDIPFCPVWECPAFIIVKDDMIRAERGSLAVLPGMIICRIYHGQESSLVGFKKADIMLVETGEHRVLWVNPHVAAPVAAAA